MNDERLEELLGSLRYERMGRAADARVRGRLEREWSETTTPRGLTWQLRRLTPAFAIAAVLAGLVLATIGAPGDSPLYRLRTTIEDGAVVLYPDPQDRAQYLLGLYEQRQAEAARLEAVGSAASHGARQIERRTLDALRGLLPNVPEEVPAPVPAPTPTPTPEPTPPATPSPVSTPTATPSAPPTPVVATPRVTPAPTRTPELTRTPTPRPTPTSTPKPIASPNLSPTATKAEPTGTPIVVTVTGTVKEQDGTTLAVQVCVSVNTSDCQVRTTSTGTYRLVANARVGQTITVYAWRTDATGRITYKGYASAVVRGSVVEMSPIVLRPY